MVREGKPKGFFYLDHRTADGKHAIITDTHITNVVHDSQSYLARLDRQIQRFGFALQSVGLYAGYFTSAVCQELEERAIEGVMDYNRPAHQARCFYKRQFSYDATTDRYRCPQQQVLLYKTINRLGYREYYSDLTHSRRCPQRKQCTHSANSKKVVTRHVWEAAKEAIDARRLTERGKRLYARRKKTVERSIVDAKQLCGHRYVRMRELAKVLEQCLLAAAC